MAAPTIASDGPAADPAVVVPLRRRGTGTPLVCIHPGSGFGLPFLTLLPHLDPQTPVYAMQARGLVTPATLPATLDEMVGDYLDQLRRIRPAAPYRLLGWCVGGRVAFELGCRLRAAGTDVELLAVVGAYPPAGRPEPSPEESLRSMVQPPDSDRLDPELSALCRLPLDHAALHDYFRRTGHPMARLNPRALDAVYAIYRNNERLARSPLLSRFDGDLRCFVPARGGAADEAASWQPFVTGKVSVQRVDCRHGEMLDRAPAQHIAAVLAGTLHRSARRTRRES